MKMVEMDQWLTEKGYQVTRKYDSHNTEYIFTIEKGGKTLTRLYKYGFNVESLLDYQKWFLEDLHSEFERSYGIRTGSKPWHDYVAYATADIDTTVEVATRILKPLSIPPIKKVIFNYPATIILWEDNTKTVVKCMAGDVWSEETGLAMAICKKLFGSTHAFKKFTQKWVPEKKETEVKYKFAGFDNLVSEKTRAMMDNLQAELYKAMLGVKTPDSQEKPAEEKKPMTCREKLAKEHPEKIDPEADGGCIGCPHHYGYAEMKTISNWCSDVGCYECWDRPVEEDAE